MDGLQEGNMWLKQTLKNHFIVLFSLIIVTIIFAILLLILNFDKNFVLAFGIFYLADLIPTLYLHIEYFLKNSGEEVKITADGIIVKKNGIERRYSKSDLTKIIVYKSASIDKGGIPIFAIESYHYARIITQTGEEIIITCLLASNLEEELKELRGISYIRKKRLFCALFWK